MSQLLSAGKKRTQTLTVPATCIVFVFVMSPRSSDSREAASSRSRNGHHRHRHHHSHHSNHQVNRQQQQQQRQQQQQQQQPSVSKVFTRPTIHIDHRSLKHKRIPSEALNSSLRKVGDAKKLFHVRLGCRILCQQWRSRPRLRLGDPCC